MKMLLELWKMPKKNTVNASINRENFHDEQLWQEYQKKVIENIQELDKTNKILTNCRGVNQKLL